MKRFLCLGLSSVVGILAAVAWAQVDPEKPKMVPIVRDYTGWKLVNVESATMDARVAMLCAPSPGFSHKAGNFSATSVLGSGGPHGKKWINVFVNSIGEEAMLTQKHPRFPQGTVIVKQKLAIPATKGKTAAPAKPAPHQQPELLTVMIKREAGYDGANGDWEWMVTDGPGLKVVENGKLAACQGCHRPYAATDFVVRSYLPASVMEALRDAPTPNEKRKSIDSAG